jgi:tol-pal system protein YbgF
MSRALGALAAVAILAGGCASRGTVTELGAEVGKLRSELAELRVAQEVISRDVARVAPQLQALDARTSETQTIVRTLTDDIVRLARRYEGVDAMLAEARARVDALAAPTPPAPAVTRPAPTTAPPGSPSVSALERPRVPAAPAPAVPPATATPLPPPAPLVPQSSPSVPPAAPPMAATAPTPAASPTPRTGNPEQEYNAALTTFRSREHGQAVLDFIDFIAKYPKHPLASNAQYWIGEAYWTQRDYRQALVEFDKVSEYGQAKAPDALVKIGLCHLRLRDVPRAQQAWQRVVREYPKSEAAPLAQSLLRTHAAARQ